MRKAVAQPPRAVSARMCQSRARPASSAAAITPDVTTAATVTMRSKRLRFIRSATAPETAPRKKNGTIEMAEDAAVTNADPVSSNTSQPVTTQFIPTAADCSSTHSHSSRKSGNCNERVHAGPITPLPRLMFDGCRAPPGGPLPAGGPLPPAGPLRPAGGQSFSSSLMRSRSLAACS